MTNDTIENLIDSLGMKGLLEAMADICLEKAEHIRTNWQSEVLAIAWERRARHLNTLAASTIMD